MWLDNRVRPPLFKGQFNFFLTQGISHRIFQLSERWTHRIPQTMSERIIEKRCQESAKICGSHYLNEVKWKKWKRRWINTIFCFRILLLTYSHSYWLIPYWFLIHSIFHKINRNHNQPSKTPTHPMDTIDNTCEKKMYRHGHSDVLIDNAIKYHPS